MMEFLANYTDAILPFGPTPIPSPLSAPSPLPSDSQKAQWYDAFKSITGAQYWLLAVVSVPLLLSLHPKNLVRRVLYYLPLFFIFKAYTTPNASGSKDFGQGYQFGLLLASWTVRITDRMYFNNPEERFLRKGLDDKGKGPVDLPIMEKFVWALELTIVTRGIGWNWEIRPIPEHKTTAKRPFLLMKARKAVMTFACLQAIVTSSKLMVEFAEAAEAGSLSPSLLAAKTVLFNTLFLHLYIYASWAFVVYSSLNLSENIFAIIFVGFGITKRWSDPAAWPGVFGSIKESYGYRRGWSKFWHQNVRRNCDTLGDFLVRNIPYLNKPSNQTAVLCRRYLKLLCVFASSAFIHAGGSLYMSAGGSYSDGGSFYGFLLQAFVVIAEDLVFYLLGIKDEGNPGLLWQILGYSGVHGYATYGVAVYKVIPLARDHEVIAPGGPLMMAVKMCGIGAAGQMKNPFAALMGSFNAN